MARTNSTAVEGILLADYDSGNSLTPFIEAASLIIDRVETCADDKELPLTDTELEMIERWLAAHLYVMSDQNEAETETLSSRVKYQGQTAMHLDSSKYGQTAMVMDFSGCLKELGAPRVSAFWLGRRPSDQTDYVDRD